MRSWIALPLATVLVAGCVQPPIAEPSVSSPATATPTSEPTAVATETPQAPTADPATLVRTNPLGPLSGNWIFAGKHVRHPVLPQVEVQIWAVPVDGGAPRLALAYTKVTAGVGPMDNSPYLRRLFSPDGKRLVVQAAGVVVVDLETGRTSSVDAGGQFLSWSKDGSRIALTYYRPVEQVVPPDIALGVVPIGGGARREIAVVDQPHLSAEWSPDGSMLLVSQRDGVAIFDVATARLVRRLGSVGPFSHSFAHWRSARPQIALGSYGCDSGNMTIVTLDDPLARERPLVTASCADADLRDPRWSPANPNELLYVRAARAPGAMPSGETAHILDLATGRDADLGVRAFEATWSSDGNRIAYIPAAPGPLFRGQSVRVWSRLDARERVVLTATGTDVFFSLASVSY